MAAPLRQTGNTFKNSVYLLLNRGQGVFFIRNKSIEVSPMMKKIMNKGNRKKTVAWSVPFNPEAQGTTVKSGAKSKVRYSDGVIRRTNWVGNVLEDTILQIFANGEMDVFVNIIKVEVVPSYSALKVWWEASGVQEKDKLNSSLKHRLANSDTELELEETEGKKLEHQGDLKRKQARRSAGHSSDLVVKRGETDVERVEFNDKLFD
ncbi:uncharacterized protein LOC128244316 [Mya arenaria]|uniref:uncharacterized protein LOC128244316 n=1 Tax=Mya arenaria TaxID=6604 RepID=UPI0022E2658A|nr:uncharacterized protein LOC128244316 [Mya arenaria]